MSDESSEPDDWIRSAVAAFEQPLLQYALHLTGDLDLARDAVQETFLRLCAQTDATVRDRLRPWLFLVCRHRAIDRIRKESRFTTICEFPAAPDRRPPPDLSAEQKELAELVSSLMEMLPPKQQEVLRLKFQNGLSYREISEVTGFTVTNVGFLIHTALKRLRGLLAARTTPGAYESQV